MSINHQELRLFYQPEDIARLTVETYERCISS